MRYMSVSFKSLVIRTERRKYHKKKRLIISPLNLIVKPPLTISLLPPPIKSVPAGVSSPLPRSNAKPALNQNR